MNIKNIEKYNISSFMCYLYIFLIVMSFLLKRESKFIYSTITVTGTILSVAILLDLKKLFNRKYLFHKIDILIYIFVLIKLCMTGADIIFNTHFQNFLQEYGKQFFWILGGLQIVYSFLIISHKFKDMKLIKIYCIFSFMSGFTTMTMNVNIFQIVFSITNAYILADIFFQSEDIVDRE